ncbi:allantoate permease [Fusarium napiforme]|uniref:Allantoate permease n=1 Tax=Fusarium napiforme TaxID=42672 RepID=A0A8H5MZQ6_9HYPO|nr:allantoate permease [Fusarium napiforme]
MAVHPRRRCYISAGSSRVCDASRFTCYEELELALYRGGGKVAVTRMARDAVSEEEHDQSLLLGLRLAVTDVRVWASALLLLSNQSAYGFNYFYPAVVRGFNLGSRTITLIYTAPPYLLGAFISFFIAWHSDRKIEGGWHISVAILFVIVGFIISAATINIPARYAASFLYICSCFVANAA